MHIDNLCPAMTFYYGQIKPEYRGNLILILERNEEKILWGTTELDQEILNKTDNIYPLRTYIGVNKKAEMEAEERYKNKDPKEIPSVNELDKILVYETVCQARSQEFDLLQRYFRAQGYSARREEEREGKSLEEESLL